MASLNSLINLSTGALSADQFALNTTAQNVANQNTPGYTRQVVSFASGDTVAFSTDTDAQAPSVTATSQRDRVLDQRVQQQTQAASESTSRSSVLTSIEGIFSLSSTSGSAGDTPIGTSLNAFFSSLTALTADPADSSTRQGVLSAAGNLASALNSASSQLASISTSIGGQLTTSAAQVNTLTQTVATLNAQIAAQSPNSDAGVLEDERQTAINQLSSLIGLDQITTEHNGITLTTTGGSPLVSGANSFNISVTNNSGTFAVLDAQGNDISSGLQGGSIGGLLTAQSSDFTTTASTLDTIAFNLGTLINQQNEAGVDANGNPGAAIFSLPATSAGAAAAISVIPTSVSAVAAAASGEGSAGNTNAEALADIATSTALTGETLTSTYAGLLGQIGAVASSVAQQSSTQQTVLTTLTTQRDSLSVVSLDEEASNLTLYQRSYQAAAKLFSVADSIAVSALNLGEETTVS